MRIIVGLGNPGRKYVFTRHNVGFMTIDMLSEQWKIACEKNDFNAIIGEGLVGDQKILIAKPQTYMNLSGISAGKITAYYGCTPDNLMIVCDDLNLPVGKIRIRRKGSSGGHNGLESVAQHVGTEFPRLRVGIGSPPIGADAKRYVLTPFMKDEKEIIDSAVYNATQAIDTWISTGIEKCMEVFN